MEIELIDELILKYNIYRESPNKTKSKILRVALGNLKNEIPSIRQTLRENDKEGYEKYRRN